MDIQESVPLSSLTTFRVGGPARFFITISDTKKLPEAVAFAQAKNLPMFFLGAGSNLLVSDDPFDAVVIKIVEKGIEYEAVETADTGADKSLVIASAGEKWDDLVRDTVERGWGGLENLSLIPGLVGAAAVQNIGAYGVELSNILEWVEVFDVESGKFVRMTRDECQFDYRMSVFKTPAGKKFIITKIALCLSLAKSARPNISYKDLAQYFSPENANISAPTNQDVRQAVIVIRRRKLPDPEIVPNAGSFFKNPIISETRATEIRAQFPLLPGHSVGGGKLKVSAAWIIDHIAGLAGRGTEKVSTYENQALVIVNRGGATSRDIKNFAETIALIVKEKTKIILEPEVEWVSNEKIKNRAA